MTTNIRNPTLLIVDDKSANHLAMQTILKRLDANIIKALSGTEALSLLLRYEIALILLDVKMPEMDGYETARIIQQDIKFRHIPIIFVTATDKDENNEFEKFNNEKVSIMYKPIIGSVLIDKIRSLINI